MWGTDAIMWQGLGEQTMVKNYYSTENIAPTISSIQSVTFQVTDTSNSRTSITTRRKIDPNAPNQFVLRLDVTMQMGFACNDDTYISTFKHTTAFAWTMNLPSDGTYANALSLVTEISILLITFLYF